MVLLGLPGTKKKICCFALTHPQHLLVQTGSGYYCSLVVMGIFYLAIPEAKIVPMLVAACLTFWLEDVAKT